MELITTLCEKFYNTKELKKPKPTKKGKMMDPKGRLYFSFFIRNTIFHKSLQNYL